MTRRDYRRGVRRATGASDGGTRCLPPVLRLPQRGAEDPRPKSCVWPAGLTGRTGVLFIHAPHSLSFRPTRCAGDGVVGVPYPRAAVENSSDVTLRLVTFRGGTTQPVTPPPRIYFQRVVTRPKASAAVGGGVPVPPEGRAMP